MNQGFQICGDVYGKSVIYEYKETLGQGSSVRAAWGLGKTDGLV